MWLLALLFVGWLFWWARHHQKERDLMVDLCAKAVFDNPQAQEPMAGPNRSSFLHAG